MIAYILPYYNNNIFSQLTLVTFNIRRFDLWCWDGDYLFGHPAAILVSLENISKKNKEMWNLHAKLTHQIQILSLWHIEMMSASAFYFIYLNKSKWQIQTSLNCQYVNNIIIYCRSIHVVLFLESRSRVFL